MKAVILHGTDSSPQNNWFPWLKEQLKDLHYKVWAPQLPESATPNIERYNKFLLESGWDFQNNLIVGHSSGAVATLGLIQALPEDVHIDTAILVGIYRGSLGRQDLKGTDITFDYEKLKSKAKRFIVVHSDNDPYCPLEGAHWIAKELNAEFRLMPGQWHFGMQQDPKFKKFPELLEIIKTK